MDLSEHYLTATRIEIARDIPFPPERVFGLLCDPDGQVDIDSTGMLQAATGDPVTGVGDTFVIHMDRESLGDYDLGQYDVTVTIVDYELNRSIAWTILGKLRPQIGHVYGYRLEPLDGGDRTRVVSYYDWTDIHEEWRAAGIFPVISPLAVRATLGILERTLRRRTEA